MDGIETDFAAFSVKAQLLSPATARCSLSTVMFGFGIVPVPPITWSLITNRRMVRLMNSCVVYTYLHVTNPLLSTSLYSTYSVAAQVFIIVSLSLLK